MLDQITPLILTYNEANNIARTLERLQWAKDIVVVDSFSDDETIKIASTFPQVRIYQRSFDCHRNQWQFGLEETNISTPWVLALDADYVLTEELIGELELLQPEREVAYCAKFIYCVNGRKLRSGIYPPVTVLYRRPGASYEQDGHTQKIRVSGPVGTLRSPVLHDDRKSLRHWFHSQTRYTELEARKLLEADRASLSWIDRLRSWRVVAPPAMLFYCLVLRGGLLDGWAGLYYAFQRTLAELMLSLYLIERSIGRKREMQIATNEAEFTPNSERLCAKSDQYRTGSEATGWYTDGNEQRN